MFERISEHVYYRMAEAYSDRPTIGYIRGAHGALLFEAGSSPKHAACIRQELTQQQLPLPSYVAVSHWHWDHTFGLCAWDVPTIAGKDTNRRLRQLQTLSWDDASLRRRVQCGEEINFCYEMLKREYPNTQAIRVVPAALEFDRELSIDLGGVTCRLLLIRGPHAYDSVICYIPEDKFVFLGDSNGKNLYLLDWKFDIAHEEDLVPTLARLPYDEDVLQAYREALSKLDFTACVSGHAPACSADALFASLHNQKA